MPMKALVTAILRDEAGGEYRLMAGEKAPPLPDSLARAAEVNGYIEKRPAPTEKPAAGRKGEK